MHLFGIITILIFLSAFFGYINVRFLKLPQTIGLMILALVFSLIMLALNVIFPTLFHYAVELVGSIDFSKVLLDMMLCFLLFAGALHTDNSLLHREKNSILLFSLVSVVVSTFVIALIMWSLTAALNFPIDFIHCLLFGALISPTDPIAVLGILTKSNVPEKVKTNIVGESLFNDGVGVVIFATIVQIIQNGPDKASFAGISLLFLQEAGGGVLFGLLLGYIMFLLLKSINHYETEVMITVAIVMGGYYIANKLHISGPLTVVVAGLITGGRSRAEAMSLTTKLYVDKFWELADVILNSILFVLIGLRLMLLHFTAYYFLIGIVAIPMALAARWISVRVPLLFSAKWIGFDKKERLLMVWGGLRGGLSIAMALSLSRDPHQDIFVFITYVIVLFSIIVQGLTLERFVKKLYKT